MNKKIVLASLYIILFSCNKDKTVDNEEKKDLFHKDFTIKEPVLYGSYSAQSSIGTFSLSDNSLIICASRGAEEPYSRGFRLARLNKDASILWCKSYYLPEAFYYQIATASTIDKDENIIISGHLFGGSNNYGKPFILKVDKNNGQILWSKYYAFKIGNEPATFRGGVLHALKNGDILFNSVTGGVEMAVFRINNTGDIVWSKKITNLGGLTFSVDVLNNSYKAFEDATGNIFMTGRNSTAPYNDYLVKLSANGEVLFCKTYETKTIKSTTPANSRIYQLSNGDILFFGIKMPSFSETPYLIKLSKNGDVISAKSISENGYVLTRRLNESIVSEDKVLLSFSNTVNAALYTFDLNFTPISRNKILAANITTNFNGTLVKDINSNFLYFIFDIAGPEGGNGFQLLKTKIDGLSCQSYDTSPEELSSSPLVVNTLTLNPTVQIGFDFSENQLDWTSTNLLILSSKDACNK